MNAQPASTRSTNVPIFAFIGLGWIATGLAAANKYGMVEADVEKQIVGCAMGILLFGLGVYLRRLHLRSAQVGHLDKARVDRIAGWTLMTIGIADVVLYVLENPTPAKSVSIVIGVGSLLALVIMWSWRLRKILLGSQSTSNRDGDTAKHVGKRRFLSIMLAFSYCYIAVLALATFVLDGIGWLNSSVPWLTLLFWIVYTTGTAAALTQRIAQIQQSSAST